MIFFETMGLDPDKTTIDWDITPAATYGLFECRGDMDRVRSKDERYYYFYINNWEKPAKLFFMERGVRHAKELANILAPQELIDNCVKKQGRAFKEQNYAIDKGLRLWITENVLNNYNDEVLVPVAVHSQDKKRETGLSGPFDPVPDIQRISLRRASAIISEKEIPGIVEKHDFFEGLHNPDGGFTGYLIDNQDSLTVTDKVTGLMWQRLGSDHGSLRKIRAWVGEKNETYFAGFNDWRLPTIEEALSLLKLDRNTEGLHLHCCFDTTQGYIFTADRRKPGGYWFVDLRQAKVFWAGGTLSGGFARVCRSINCLESH